MKRRQFFITAAGAVMTLSTPGYAQQAGKMLRVGAVSGQPRNSPYWTAFLRRMSELGYQDGTNFSFELIVSRAIDGYAAGYRELAGQNVDILLASGSEVALKSAIDSSTTIPVVMIAIDFDPLAGGYVTSLARPTGNATGVFLQPVGVTEKRLQLLKLALPDMQAATVFWDRTTTAQWQAAQGAAGTLGLRLSGFEFTDPPYDYDKALATVEPASRGTIFVLDSPFFFRDLARQAEFALRNRIATMFTLREWVDAGGLMSYGSSINSLVQLAAGYVDRIARGAKPADLPIEQATKFELVVNLKTAKVLGITLSPNVISTADEVIE
jgi:putative tryptophan/tyrosine transport system substrate-binding protein